MMLNDITALGGRYKRRMRVGRGDGSGKGKTCGRGHKGQQCRSGGGTRPLTEGGQMPLFRRLPKRGFNNSRFRRRFEIVNVGDLERFEAGAAVAAGDLAEAGLVRHGSAKVKILGNGELSKKLEVRAAAFSKSAAEKITAAGGTATVEE